MELLLSALGTVIFITLMVNAYFTRRTLEKITHVELRLVELITKHDATDERSRKNEREIEKLRDRVHKLEGGQMQLLSFLKETEND